VEKSGADPTPVRTASRNEKKYQKFLEDYLGPVSGLLVLCLALFAYRLPLPTAELLAGELALNQEEQAAIIPPLAGLLDKQGWSEKTRTALLQSGDYLGLGLGLFGYGARVLGVLGTLAKGGNLATQSTQAPVSTNGNGNGNANGHVPVPDGQWDLSQFGNYRPE
jgi:hypothetical protein